MKFQKGQSGNPGGRPKAVRELLERARTSVSGAFDLAEGLLANEEADPRVRLDAAKFLVSYGLGAPPKTLATEDEGDDMPVEELIAKAKEALARHVPRDGSERPADS